MKKPETMGQLAAKLAHIRNKIDDMTLLLSNLKREEYQAENLLILAMKEQSIDSVRGGTLTFAMSEVNKKTVGNWDSFYQQIIRLKRPDLLQRRLAEAPYNELLEQRKGKDLPGIETFTKIKLRVASVAKSK